MKTDVLFSSSKDDWRTPRQLFEELNREFGFELDVAADAENALLPEYFTAEQDGLVQDWGGRRCWCNPPYSEVALWAKKAVLETRKPGTLVVMLVPARTDTAWFHNYVYNRCELRFIRGRLRFSGSSVNAPFPSMICIFRGPGGE